MKNIEPALRDKKPDLDQDLPTHKVIDLLDHCWRSSDIQIAE